MTDAVPQATELAEAPKLLTWTFEGVYTESDEAGTYCAIVQAYTREQAIALAGIQVMDDNDWEAERIGEHKTFGSFFEEEIDVIREFTDTGGTICPNCSAEGSYDIRVGDNDAKKCGSCHFMWIPIGKDAVPRPSSESIDRDIANAWAEYFPPQEEEEDLEPAISADERAGEYLIRYGADNDMMTFLATGYENAIKMFLDLEPVSPDEQVNRDSINDVCLLLPMTAVDNAVLVQTSGTPDLEWNSRSQDNLWIGVKGVSIKIKHEDEGIAVDLYEQDDGDDLGEATGSTYAFFPAGSDED